MLRSLRLGDLQLMLRGAFRVPRIMYGAGSQHEGIQLPHPEVRAFASLEGLADMKLSTIHHFNFLNQSVDIKVDYFFAAAFYFHSPSAGGD